jgi:hypothetical protein
MCHWVSLNVATYGERGSGMFWFGGDETTVDQCVASAFYPSLLEYHGRGTNTDYT